jgi:putative ATP-dependent endonuclease of OLD family
VLLTEGATEATSYAAAGRRLNELASARYNSLEAMGIAIFDVRSETAVAEFGKYFKDLGKTVFAVFDKQNDEALMKIEENVEHPFESQYKGFENLLLDEIDEDIVIKYYKSLIADKEWPTHLDKHKPKTSDDNIKEVKPAVYEYLKWNKGAKSASELIAMCTDYKHIPVTIRKVLRKIKKILEG